MKYYKGDVVEPLIFHIGTREFKAREPKKIEHVLPSKERTSILLKGASMYISADSVRLYHRPFLNHVKSFFNFKR